MFDLVHIPKCLITDLPDLEVDSELPFLQSGILSSLECSSKFQGCKRKERTFMIRGILKINRFQFRFEYLIITNPIRSIYLLFFELQAGELVQFLVNVQLLDTIPAKL